MKKVRARLLLLLLVLLISVGSSCRPPFPMSITPLPAWAKSIVPNKGISLGLDFQGGIHMVLEVDEDRAVEIAVDRPRWWPYRIAGGEEESRRIVKRASPTRIVIQFQNADLKAQVQKLLDEFPTFTEIDSDGSANSLVWELREAEQAH